MLSNKQFEQQRNESLRYLQEYFHSSFDYKFEHFWLFISQKYCGVTLW